jgi:NAD(P)-dependent dehydrogenase (short-subunit alcohol dehydrogenase family)
MRLAGKRALVTGAASGIGRAVVSVFQREGAEVIGADMAYPSELSAGNDHEQVVHLDVSEESDWVRLSENVGRVDVLVGCAGISAAKPITETTLDDWRRVLEVNLNGAFLSLKFAAEVMQSGGTVVLVGSVSGIRAAAGAAAYCASKAGLSMLARTAALEFKSRAIRVNCVSPAAVLTPMWQKMPFWRDLVEKHGGEQGAWNALGGTDPAVPSIQRMAFPEEVANAIRFSQ